MLHSWLGILVVPWIILIGATGFYLNHSKSILQMLEPAAYDESRFADWPGAAPLDQAAARRIARGIWPEARIERTEIDSYHGLDAFIFRKAPGRIIVARDTGHYFVKTDTSRTTFAPDGTRLHRKIYWGSVFKQIHTDGWLGGALGSVLADITSLAMVVFGTTGIALWWMPRAKRLRRLFVRTGP